MQVVCEQQRQLLALRPSTPTKAALVDTELAGKLVKHASNYKTAIDTIRIACANADLAGELAPFLARPAEAKRALRNLLAAPGHVRVERPPPASTQVSIPNLMSIAARTLELVGCSMR